jgi:hypothetical protein
MPMEMRAGTFAAFARILFAEFEPYTFRARQNPVTTDAGDASCREQGKADARRCIFQ